ncbi:MAG: hypothetical protein LBV43_15255 [Prevotella sp.]|jgi:hypothetical protein|nr:hypothetical protein [Prevotella sp.]
MNILFHLVTSVGVTVIVTDTTGICKVREGIIPGICAFSAGLIIHGILDYLPHTYPFSATVDVFLSLLVVAALIISSKPKYWLIICLAMLGSVFPDVIDLLPSILNKYLTFDLPVGNKIFPWHWADYSGSIFIGKSIASDINHFSVLIITIIVCYCRRKDFIEIFIKRKYPLT